MTVTATVSEGLLASRIRSLFTDGRRTGPGAVGTEVELIPVRRGAGLPSPAALPDVLACLGRDPSLRTDGRITFEPGGQLELSPPPSPSAGACLTRIEGLISRLRRCGDDAGIAFLGAAVSPWHDAEQIGLQNDQPRYRAMQAHFDTVGPSGRRMMRQTAALQVCVDGAGLAWEVLNAAGPVLAATFAASPLLSGRPTGLRSTRTRLWLDTDPSRTGFGGRHTRGDAPEAYTEFALDARAILLERPGDGGEAPAPASLRALLAAGRRRPDADDLDHHLTTLFPPVRPRGYLEVRCLDGQPLRWLRAAVCLVAVLAADPRAGREALTAIGPPCRPAERSWRRAAHRGPADADLRATALSLLDIAIAAVPRLPAGYLPRDAGAALAEHRERFTESGRCPADELLEAHLADPEDLTTWM